MDETKVMPKTDYLPPPRGRHLRFFYYMFRSPHEHLLLCMRVYSTLVHSIDDCLINKIQKRGIWIQKTKNRPRLLRLLCSFESAFESRGKLCNCSLLVL